MNKKYKANVLSGDSCVLSVDHETCNTYSEIERAVIEITTFHITQNWTNGVLNHM